MRKAIWVMILICAIAGASCGRNDRAKIEELRQQCSSLMGAADKGSLDSLASEMLRISREEGNPTMEGFAHFFLSHYEPDLDDSTKSQRLHHLRLATEMAESTANDTLLCRVYNQNGVWELLDLRNISTSQYWFSKSIAAASRLNNRSFGIPAEVNLSETYRFDNDTLGIKYDLDLFRYASETDDPLLKFSAAMHCATHYSTTVNDTAELRPYIDALTAVDDQFPGTADYIYARHFFATGDYEKAEQFLHETDSNSYSDYLMLLAHIFNKTRRYDKSQKILRIVRERSDRIAPSNMKDYLRLAASNESESGNYKESCLFLKELDLYSDSLSKARNEDMTRRYRIEYEILAKDMEIKEHRMRFRNLVVTGGAAAAVIVVIAAAVLMWIRRRNSMYRDIVRQNKDFIERQKQLSERLTTRDNQIADLKLELNSAANKSSSQEIEKPASRLPEEKINSIFERIQYFTDDRQIWRDTSVTRESFAAMVGCNRTYFSEVLKIKTGMGYSQFMNACRVNEAIRVLSNPSEDISIKDLSERIGFLSTNTFHAAFRQITGMTPDRYRKTAKQL